MKCKIIALHAFCCKLPRDNWNGKAHFQKQQFQKWRATTFLLVP